MVAWGCPARLLCAPDCSHQLRTVDDGCSDFRGEFVYLSRFPMKRLNEKKARAIIAGNGGHRSHGSLGPAFAWYPFPRTAPSLTITHPTHGLGAAVCRPQSTVSHLRPKNSKIGNSTISCHLTSKSPHVPKALTLTKWPRSRRVATRSENKRAVAWRRHG